MIQRPSWTRPACSEVCRLQLPAGTVLIIVLVAMSLLALSAYTFANLMLDHRTAVEGAKMRIQSDAAVASAADAMRAFLMQPPIVRQQQGGVYDNPTFFAFQRVVDDPSPQFSSQFSVLSTELGDVNAPSTTRFGLVDESSKLNLNQLVADEEDPTLSQLTLMVLPGMSIEIADAILDWIDEDTEKRENGAEGAEDYAGFEPPRSPSDGPIHSLSELLLVRGITPELLYGADANRNGVIDPAEAQFASALAGMSGTTEEATVAGSMEFGWSAYLTLFSRERNIDPDGNYRINLNQEDLEDLHARITEIADADTATFIVAIRQFGLVDPPETEVEGVTESLDASFNAANGPAEATGPPEGQNEDEESEEPEPVGGRTVDLTQPAEFDIDSVIQLFDARSEVTFEGEEEPVLVQSPIAVGDMPELLDYVTVTDERAIPGRININQAPRAVLATVIGLSTEAIDQIMAVRDALTAADFGRTHPVWILNEGIVDLETMNSIIGITGGGDVYSADIVASTGDGDAVRRVHVILDATRPEVPQLLWQDKEFLGRGFAREELLNE